MLLDKIHIRDILLRGIIGINPEEREKKQDILINICLEADLKEACYSDDINDTVDYKEIKQKIIGLVEESSFFLVEKLCQEIADLCLSYQRVRRVKVLVEKPTALRFARTVGVEITREKI